MRFRVLHFDYAYFGKLSTTQWAGSFGSVGGFAKERLYVLADV